MPITVVATGNAVTTTSRSPAITFASWTPRTDDVVVFFAASTTAAAAATAPTNWVMPTPASGANPVASDSHTYAFTYYQVTSTDEGAVTLTYTATNLWNATQTGNVCGIVLRSVDPANVIDSLVSTFNSTNTVTPHVLPSLTGSNLSTNSLVVRGVAADGTDTWTTPASHTARGTNNTNQGNALYTMDALTTAGSNVASTNITPATGDEYCSFSAAFSLSPKLSTFSDDFAAGVGNWSNTAGVSADSAGARITHAATAGAYESMTLPGYRDFSDDTAFLQVRYFGDQSLTTHYIRFWVLTGSSDGVFIGAQQNLLHAFKRVGGSFTQIGSSITLNPVLHAWLRIREASGTVFYDTGCFDPATGEIVWTNRWSVATPVPLTSVQVFLEGAADSAEATGSSVLFDNFNKVVSNKTYSYKTAVLRAGSY